MKVNPPAKRRAFLLMGVTAALVLITALLPRVAQPQSYHDFADTRPLLGVPNAGDVLSNIGFLLVGAYGVLLLMRRRGTFIHAGERNAYLVFFAAITLTAFGSAYYHLAPDNDRLFWDRLPIALAASAILAAVVGDRLGMKAANWALIPLLALSAASTIYWIHSEHAGHGDLRFYVLAQAFPALIIPVLVLATPQRYTRTGDLLLAGGFYGLAKLCEIFDKPIFSFGDIVSGHTLKHLFAAAGAYVLLQMLVKRNVTNVAEAQQTRSRPAGNSA